MARYRYRTAALAGRWRDSPAAALRDAVKAQQAREDPAAPDGVRWLVPGEVESDQDDLPRAAAAGRRLR